MIRFAMLFEIPGSQLLNYAIKTRPTVSLDGFAYIATRKYANTIVPACYYYDLKELMVGVGCTQLVP